ncbi:MAG TPA: sigma-70 family RNA polymerase sigma factor [Verrucomicrobiae bacterium]|nr:sigma-70 family RNA polymerase sigma factor [Verrucomicrobiae bacterium]
MAVPDLNPSPGGPGGMFTTTHWSVVLAAAQQSTPESAEALAELCRAYWYPLYSYVRRKGYDVADAQDLTQEFFARFLARHYLGSIDRRKGKFRSFLLASLEHFLAKEWTRAHRLKRGGGVTIVAWDGCDPEERYQLEPPDTWTAERIYERRWALTVLEQAMAALGAEYVAAGKTMLFEGLKPFLSGEDEDLSYPELAARLQLNEGALRVALHRLRRGYGEYVRDEIAKLVQRPEDIEDELRHLFAALR